MVYFKIILYILGLVIAYGVGWVHARTQFTGIEPDDWKKPDDYGGSGADDGGPNFH